MDDATTPQCSAAAFQAAMESGRALSPAFYADYAALMDQVIAGGDVQAHALDRLRRLPLQPLDCLRLLCFAHSLALTAPLGFMDEAVRSP